MNNAIDKAIDIINEQCKRLRGVEEMSLCLKNCDVWTLIERLKIGDIIGHELSLAESFLRAAIEARLEEARKYIPGLIASSAQNLIDATGVKSDP